MIFRDRTDAGRQLAARLKDLAAEDPIILGLPRGGVPVAGEVAQALAAPLDVIVVRKLGAPFREEFAMGAIGDGVEVLHDDTIRSLGVTPAQLEEVRAREQIELDRRLGRFRAGRAPLNLKDRTAIVVDDGIATGATAMAACEVVRTMGAARVVLAVPVAPPEFDPGELVDEYIFLERPQRFMSIGQSYADFTQTTDDEVLRWLSEA